MIYKPKKMAPGEGGASTRRTPQVYRPLQLQSISYDADAMAVAEAHDARARQELRLLACTAVTGTRGLALAEAAGITADHFGADDAIVVYRALVASRDAGTLDDRDATAAMVRDALQAEHLWDADDTRRWIAGARWGPGAVGTLLYRITTGEAERMLPILLGSADGDTSAADILFGRPSTTDAPADDAPLVGPVLVCMADVVPREIDWLWPGRIPSGCITLLIGRPKEGKSFATIDIAARVSTGSPWPDGNGDAPRGSVIFITAEDDPARVIRPRLDAHRADCRRIHQFSTVHRLDKQGRQREVMFSLADVDEMEAALRVHDDCRLVIIDPIGSFLGGGTDAHRDNEVRAVLAPVAKLAEQYGVAVLVVAHRRKGGGNVADDLAMGSKAFTGLARANWHLSRDPQNKSRRLLLPGGGNYFDDAVDGLAFTIAGDPPSITWERDPVTMSADDALAAENAGGEGSGRPADKRDDATEWLSAELADLQEHPVADLRRDAQSAGVTWRTVQRAAGEMQVIRQRSGFGGAFVWRLPRPAPTDPADAAPIRATIRATTPKDNNSGTYGTIGEFEQKRGFSGGTSVPKLHTCQYFDSGTYGESDGPPLDIEWAEAIAAESESGGAM